MLVLTRSFRYHGIWGSPISQIHFCDYASDIWLLAPFGSIVVAVVKTQTYAGRVSFGTRCVVAFQQGCYDPRVTEVLDRPPPNPKWMFMLWDEHWIGYHWRKVSNGALIGVFAYNLGCETPCSLSRLAIAYVKCTDFCPYFNITLVWKVWRYTQFRCAANRFAWKQPWCQTLPEYAREPK